MSYASIGGEDLMALLTGGSYTVLTEYGQARHTKWTCEDKWVVGYTTERITKSRDHDGKWAVLAWKPDSKKDPSRWEIVYFRTFSTRKAAKKRAIEVYAKHSPRWAKRHGM